MRETIDVRIQQGNGWFWPLLLIFGAIFYWKWVLFVVGLIAAAFLLGWGIKCIREDTRDRLEVQKMRQEQLAWRADAENALWHAGDPRGFYGMDYQHGQEQDR